LEEKHERYADEWTKAVESVAVAERLKSRLSALRDQVRALKPDYELAKENVGAEDQSERLEEQYTQACNRLMSLEGELSSMRASLNRATEARERARKLDHDVEDLQARMGGKRVAESALKSIEDGANAMLRECGIDLSVEVQWSREGGGLARSCDACGHPFGTSAKVKRCERCGADRGPLLVNKLELVLSDRSGAAEDLAGASIQLSASAWLREDRGSAWSVALVDEPYGALDASNRKAFSTHIASMLAGRYGFVQAFVVSHSPDTVTQLPGRIEILNDGGRATVRVV
jgi:DNA repair exonuclease SbcCD ATPase subunit